LSRTGALDRIDVLLSTITDPAFVAVIRAEPLALSGTPVLAYWVQARTNGWQTLSDIGSTTTIMVRAYFRLQASADVRESIELELWDSMVEVDTVLRGDANLDGNCTDSTVGSATVSTIDMGGGLYRTATIPFDIQIYEEITITP
jgi:hypothetical protein